MSAIAPPCRPATVDDADALAELVNIAGEGLPLYLWSGIAIAGESPWDVGRGRACRESGAFSYRNAVIREEDGRPASCLIGYPLADEPEAVVYSEMPPMFVPLQQLEDLVPGTWYLNVLATYPGHRGRGFGRELLAVAEALAHQTRRRAMSLIVSDANHDARRLYERLGYREHAARPMVKERWQHPGERWVLLVKAF